MVSSVIDDQEDKHRELVAQRNTQLDGVAFIFFLSLFVRVVQVKNVFMSKLLFLKSVSLQLLDQFCFSFEFESFHTPSKNYIGISGPPAPGRFRVSGSRIGRRIATFF